jgi:DNA-binding MarR family transcriptional regulator
MATQPCFEDFLIGFCRHAKLRCNAIRAYTTITLVYARILWNRAAGYSSKDGERAQMTIPDRKKLLRECAYFDVRRASRALSRFYDHFLPAGSMIRDTQFSLLRMIMIENELTLSTLSRYMVMDRTSVTRALDPLLRDKFVKIRKSEDDKRVRYVSLTKKGEEAVRLAEPYWQKAQEALMDAIGPARWHSMRSALRDTTSRIRHAHDDETVYATTKNTGRKALHRAAAG